MNTPSQSGRRSVPPTDADDDGYAWNYYGRDALPDPTEDPEPASPRTRRSRRRSRETATDQD